MNKDVIQTIVRAVLKAGGGALASHGVTSDSGLEELAGAVSVVIGFIWGICHRTPKAAAATDASGPPITGPHSAIVFAALMVGAALVLPGCATRPVVTTGTNGVSVTNFVKGPDVELIAGIAGEAAQVGSQFWINGHPNDRAIFVAVNESLKVLIDQKNYDPSAFYAAMAGLPIRELKTTNGNASLIIQGAIFVFKTGAMHADGVLRQELVAATLSSVQQGIQSALDATTPRSEYFRRFQERADLFLPDVAMPRWRPALQPAEVYALLTWSAPSF